MLDAARFWLDRGVDGFRVDAHQFCDARSGADAIIRLRPQAMACARGRSIFSCKLHNQSHPDIPLFIERIRALTDEYDARFTVAEVGGPIPMREMKAFTDGRNAFQQRLWF